MSNDNLSTRATIIAAVEKSFKAAGYEVTITPMGDGASVTCIIGSPYTTLFAGCGSSEWLKACIESYSTIAASLDFVLKSKNDWFYYGSPEAVALFEKITPAGEVTQHEIKGQEDDYDVTVNDENVNEQQAKTAVPADFEFEKAFSELQADMVSTCLRFLEKCEVSIATVDNIYIYCNYGFDGFGISNSFFFRVNGKMVNRANVSPTAYSMREHHGTDRDYQGKALDGLEVILKELDALCTQHNRPMPKEMRLVYDAKEGSLEVAYQYEPSKDEEKISDHFEEEWFEQLTKS